MLDFLEAIISFLQREKISYMLSGSVALSIYTLPRATRDLDFVINLRVTDAEKLAQAFGEGYYCNVDSVKGAVKRGGMFNIIDHKTGFKADFVILKNQPFRQTEFKRRIPADFFGIPIYVVTPEDLLLSKLIWIQDLQSNIQMEDIRSLARLPELDWVYIQHWVSQLNLNTFDLI